MSNVDSIRDGGVVLEVILKLGELGKNLPPRQLHLCYCFYSRHVSP